MQHWETRIFRTWNISNPDSFLRLANCIGVLKIIQIIALFPLKKQTGQKKHALQKISVQDPDGY